MTDDDDDDDNGWNNAADNKYDYEDNHKDNYNKTKKLRRPPQFFLNQPTGPIQSTNCNFFGSLQTSLLDIVGVLAGGWSVAVAVGVSDR